MPTSKKKKRRRTERLKQVKSTMSLKKSRSYDDRELLGTFSDMVGKGDDDNGNEGGNSSSRRSLLKPMSAYSSNYNDRK